MGHRAVAAHIHLFALPLGTGRDAMIAACAFAAAGAVTILAIFLGVKRMSAATERLSNSVQALSVSVDALVARAESKPAPPAPPPPLDESLLVAAADAVDSLKARVDAALPVA